MVRGCYGGMEAGVTVPTATSMAGVADEHCSYNVNQTPDDSETVDSSDQKWYAKGFYGRQGSQDNKHADYFVTDCTQQPRGDTLEGYGSALCNEEEGTDNLNENGEARQNVGNTTTGFTGSIYCHSDYDKSGMRKIMADSKWSKVHLSNDLEATVVGTGAVIGGVVLGPIGGAVGAGIGKAVYDGKGKKLSELYLDSKVSDLKIERLPLRKAMPNDDDHMSYDCSNRKSEYETFQNRCGDNRVDTGVGTRGGAGAGYKNTANGALRDRCHTKEFTLQTSCGATGLMSTTAFRDPRLLGLNSQDNSDPKNLSTDSYDSIGWKDVQEENQEACCLGGGTFIQTRRPMGEECAVHGDCVDTELGDDGKAKATTIKCFDKDKPHEYVKEGKTGICRREKEGTCFDRVVFRSKYEPFDYGYYLATDGKKCTYRLPVEQSDLEKRQSSDPKRLEVQGNAAAHPRTCDPNWSAFYSEHHVHLPSWVKACSIHFETFCRQVVDGVPRWRRDDKVGEICRAWVRGRQLSGKDLQDETKVKAKTSENLLLQKMCARANLSTSLAGEMLRFCNGRVTEDCVGGKGHCPRWKTNRWREFCEEKLGSHFPVQHDRLVWKYCKEHPLDPACDCLAGEYVDPNASFVEATDAIPCGEPRVCKDADGKEVPGIRRESECGKCEDNSLKDKEACKAAGKAWTAYAWKKVPAQLSKDRYDSRRFTCMTYNGDTIKQVGTMNRNLWVSACNPSLAATSNAHVLLPKHKWAEAKGSKSCDIDVQSDLYTEGDHCPLTEYQCQKQEVPESVCINMLDLRNQTCVAVGGGACTKIDNLSQLNNCGFQDLAKKQNECYAKPECKDGGCSYSFSNRLITEPQLVDGAMQQVEYKCETVSQCPKPSDCTGDCSVMCLGGGGQNCVGNKCTTDKGDCYRVTETCSTPSNPAPQQPTLSVCPTGSGWDRAKQQCIVDHVETAKDTLDELNRKAREQRERDKACGCGVGKGFDMDKGKCVEGFQTTKAAAARCPTIFTNNNACCNEVGKGWVPDASSLPFSEAFAARVCKAGVLTTDEAAAKCKAETDRLHQEHTARVHARNKACCGVAGLGIGIHGTCVEGAETSLDNANDCIRRTWRPIDYVFLSPLLLVAVGIALAMRQKTRKMGSALAAIGVVGTLAWGGYTGYKKA